MKTDFRNKMKWANEVEKIYPNNFHSLEAFVLVDFLKVILIIKKKYARNVLKVNFSFVQDVICNLFSYA